VTYRLPQARENAADARDRACTRPTPYLPSSRSSRRSPFETFAIVTDHSAAPILANHSRRGMRQLQSFLAIQRQELLVLPPLTGA
jgi:hypothetical protein